MGTYQDSVLNAWKQVNQVTASLRLTGAAPAFRQAIAQTDFASLVPSWDFGQFKVYVLDWLEGQMVYIDTAANMAVIGRHLWTIISCDYKVLDQFVEDLSRGASGVKVIDYETGPYRNAGKAWRALNEEMTPVQDPMTDLRTHLENLLSRAHAIGEGDERSSEQFQTLFTEVAAARDKFEALQGELRQMESMLDLVTEVVAEL